MASLFEIGKSGVQAYRQALSVTGQNIAHINTDYLKANYGTFDIKINNKDNLDIPLPMNLNFIYL